MKIVSYNIQFSLGKDERLDLDRITGAVTGADLIGLQEVERNWDRGAGLVDQPAEIAARLPDHYWVYHPGFDMDASRVGAEGRIENRRRQHGVMFLSRWPVLSSRPLPFPKEAFGDRYNMHMGALEAVVETPLGPLRVYVLHLGYLDPPERLAQLERLFALVAAAPEEGGAWCGPPDCLNLDWSAGAAAPPMPRAALLLGDFNSLPSSQEYHRVTVLEGWCDAWVGAGNAAESGITRPADATLGATRGGRIDYCFLSPELAPHLAGAWIDNDAQGSDHQPVWAELGQELT